MICAALLILLTPAALGSVWNEANTNFPRPMSGNANPTPTFRVNQVPKTISESSLNLTAAAQSITGEVTSLASSAYAATSGVVSNVINDTERAAEGTKAFVQTTYSTVVTEVSDTVEDTENFFTSSWDAVSSFSSNAASGVGNFFVSGYNKVTTWWSELEDEVKDFIHFILKLVDIAIGLAIFLFFLWVIYKVRQTYNYVERHTSVP